MFSCSAPLVKLPFCCFCSASVCALCDVTKGADRVVCVRTQKCCKQVDFPGGLLSFLENSLRGLEHKLGFENKRSNCNELSKYDSFINPVNRFTTTLSSTNCQLLPCGETAVSLRHRHSLSPGGQGWECMTTLSPRLHPELVRDICVVHTCTKPGKHTH